MVGAAAIEESAAAQVARDEAIKAVAEGAAGAEELGEAALAQGTAAAEELALVPR